MEVFSAVGFSRCDEEGFEGDGMGVMEAADEGRVWVLRE